MELFRVSRDLYSQEVLEGISWDLLPVAFGVGALVVIVHAAYRGLRGGRRVVSGAKMTVGSSVPDVERIERHKGIDRLFHWITAFAVLALMGTGLLPVLGAKFEWVTVHWLVGIILIALVLFHGVRSAFWQSLPALWISAADVGDQGAGKYSLAQKLMHHAMTLMVLCAVGTGAVMLAKVATPFWPRNPYLVSTQTWGMLYVVHGIAALSAVSLVVIHVYFGLIPENRMYLRAMIRGWMTRQEFLSRIDNRTSDTQKAQRDGKG